MKLNDAKFLRAFIVNANKRIERHTDSTSELRAQGDSALAIIDLEIESFDFGKEDRDALHSV